MQLLLSRMGVQLVAEAAPASRAEVISLVCRIHGLKPSDLRGPMKVGKADRKRLAARDQAIWMLRRLPDDPSIWLRKHSYPNIARYFGLEDHTSVMAAERRHEARMAERAA